MLGGTRSAVVLATAVLLTGVGGCSDPRAHLPPRTSRAAITFRLSVPPEENRAFRKALTAHLAGLPFSGSSVVLLPATADTASYALLSVRSCQNTSGVPRRLFEAAAPQGRAESYRALANATFACVERPLVQRACSLTNAFGGKPAVSDERTARAIFKAIEKDLKPDANRSRFPDVEVVDYGDHWAVFRVRSPWRFLFWRGGVNYGGGQLGLYIDKCDGSLSDVQLSE